MGTARLQRVATIFPKASFRKKEGEGNGTANDGDESGDKYLQHDSAFIGESRRLR